MDDAVEFYAKRMAEYLVGLETVVMQAQCAETPEAERAISSQTIYFKRNIDAVIHDYHHYEMYRRVKARTFLPTEIVELEPQEYRDLANNLMSRATAIARPEIDGRRELMFGPNPPSP